MSKVFDKVSHEKLLKKLHHYGFGRSLLAWFKSYLRNRSQRVTALGATPSSLPVTSGVPQGSTLGPTLFLLFVNSLPVAVHNSQLAAFAEDTEIFKTIKLLLDTAALQKDISSFVTWSDYSGLSFSLNKSKAQRITRTLRPVTSSYHMKESVLESVSAGKDLGLNITDDLTWSKHVGEQCAKANKLLGFIRRNTKFVKQHISKALCLSCINETTYTSAMQHKFGAYSILNLYTKWSGFSDVPQNSS